MAGVSDGLLVATLISYVAAMVAHAVHVVHVVHLTIREPAAVPAAVPAVPAGLPRRDVVARCAGPATALITVAGVLAHAAAVLTRAAAAGRVPLGNMYEFILAASLVGAVAWLVILVRRPAARGLGLFATLALVILLGAAGRLHVRAEPLVPALESPWLRIHVGSAVVATGLLLVGFVTTVLYLARLRHDAAVAAGRRPGPTLSQLPDPAALDRLALRVHQVAFPVNVFVVNIAFSGLHSYAGL